MLLSPALVRGQDGTPSPSPSPTASALPKTQEEIDLENEIKLLTLKKQLEDLKKGIRDDQPAPASPPAPTATPLEGKTTADDNVMLEVEIVSYQALSEAAEKIGEEINKKVPNAKAFAIYNAKDVAAWRFYASMFPAFKGQLVNFADKYKVLGIVPPTPRLKRSEEMTKEEKQAALHGAGLPGISEAQAGLEAGASALRAFVDLIALFRTDTEIKGKAVTIDESAFVAEIIRALENKYQKKAAFYYPAVFPPQAIDPTTNRFFNSPSLAEIGMLFRLENAAISAIDKLTKLKEAKTKLKSLSAEIEQNEATISESKTALPKLEPKLKQLERALRRTRPGTAQAARLEEQIKALKKEIKDLSDVIERLTKRNTEATKELQELTDALPSLVAAVPKGLLADPGKAKPAEIQLKIDALKTLNEEFDKFTAGFVTINESTGVNPLTLFIKAENLEKILEECQPKPGETDAVPCERTSYWLELKTLKAGGNNRTRKNLIRYVSGAKIDHSGGVIIECTLYDKTGAIAYSDKYSFYNGYVEPKRITSLKDKVP
jgi:hypothetical protein